MDDEQVLERKLERWASMLEREDKVEHALRRLESVSINLRLLTITGIGKSVNSLRKHPKLGDRVTALVTRWKDIARAETAAAAAKQLQETSDHSSGNNNSNDEEHGSGEEEQAEEAISEAKKSFVPHVRSNPKEPQRRKRPLPIVNEIQLNGHRRREPEVDDDEPLDPFSAQLASADRVVFVRRAVKKKHAKITAESIQDSLLDSLANPTLGQQATVAVVQKPAPSQSHQFYTHEPISTDIMFKAPKENRRVYAGRKRNATPADQEVPRLYDICIRVLTNNIDAIEETGDIPFDILQPVLEKANAAQLRRLEEKNPHLQEETDPLWVAHCERDFAKEFAEMLAVLENQKNGGDEEEEEEDADMMDFYQMDGLSWRQRYQKFARERERRLRQLSNKIKSKTNEIIEPQRQTMVTAPIAPRNVRRRQIQNGMTISADRVPTAMQLTKARRQIFETGNDADLRQMPSAIRNTTSKLGSRPGGGGFHSATASTTKKPQRGPLMLKTLKMLKQQRR